MNRKFVAGVLLISSIALILAGSGTIGASSVVSTASSPETLVVTVSTNDYSNTSPSGVASAEPGVISFGSFVGEERAINEAVKVTVKTNGQWSMQVEAEPMRSSIIGEEHIQLPAEQFQKRAIVGIGSDTLPELVSGINSYSLFNYDEYDNAIPSAIIQNAAPTGDGNGTHINIGLKTMLTFADPAREYQSLITVTTTAAF